MLFDTNATDLTRDHHPRVCSTREEHNMEVQCCLRNYSEERCRLLACRKPKDSGPRATRLMQAPAPNSKTKTRLPGGERSAGWFLSTAVSSL